MIRRYRRLLRDYRSWLLVLLILGGLWLGGLPGLALGQEEPEPEQEEPVDEEALAEEAEEQRENADSAGIVVEGGNAGVQEQDSGTAEAGAATPPRAPDAGTAPARTPPAGTAPGGTAPGAAPERPRDTAGNVADQGGTAAPAAGAAGGPNVVDQATRPDLVGPQLAPPLSGPAAPPVERELPSFAEEQPGFIPDVSPEELFSEKRQELYVFGSPLGDERVPSEEAEDIIGSSQGSMAGRLEPNYARVVVPDGTISGSTETKQFHIEGGLTIYYGDVSISAETADIDEKEEVAHLVGDVNIVDPKYRMKTDDLVIKFEEKKLRATGFVTFSKLADRDRGAPDMSLPKKDRLREHFAAQQFQLFTQDLYYNWDTLEMTAIGSVRLIHPSFNGTMERLDYNDETKHYIVEGNVILDVSDYGWIFANKLVEPEDEQKVRAITDSPTKIHCARLVYSEESAVAEFYALPGELVSFVQNARDIKASYIEVNDNTKDFYAEGVEGAPVVFHQANGDWLIKGGLIEEGGVAPELQETLTGEVTAKANTLTYNFDRKRIELKGAVDVAGSGRSLTAENLVQDDTSKYFLLQGNVVLRPEQDSTIYAAQVFFDTQNDIVTFVGLVEGRVTSDEVPAAEREEGAGEAQIQQGVFRQVGGGGAGGQPTGNVAQQ